MATPLSQKELSELEQSKVDGATLIEAAASFLRCNLKALENKAYLGGSERTPRKNTLPREEFVLKLLLRRLSKSEDIFDTKFWTLLAHLLEVIPIKGLARLLGERDFFQSLNDVLGGLLEAKPEPALDAQYETSSDEDSGRPIKKQRLGNLNARPDIRPVQILNLACSTVSRLVQLATDNLENDEISRNAIRNVLSASPEAAADVTGKLLQLTQKSIAHEAFESERLQHTDVILNILSIWTYRRPDTINSSAKSSDQCFTLRCLRPALGLLTELEHIPDVIKTLTYTTAIKALERLIALHSVLPLRSLFLAEKSQQWRAKTNNISWHDFEDIHAVVSVMLLSSNSSDVNVNSESSFATMLQYYSIAVRAVPRPTLRRVQQEQPWLDCLFCVCAYLGDPMFPKMEVDGGGHLTAIDSAEVPISKALNETLNNLFTLASAKAVRLSLPVLLYFTAALLEVPTNRMQWAVLAKIVEQDINVLVPTSGLPETTALLEVVFERLSSTNNEDIVDYSLVRDGIIRRLLRGFAQARDLKGFVALWLKALQDVIQQRASGDLQYGQSHLSFVWEDEWLFKDFEATSKALTTSTFARSMTTQMLVLLQQAATRIGPTSDILSHVAVTTSLLNARPNDLDTVTLKGIIAAAISALSRRSDYQLQRWRLGRLLRSCLVFVKSSADIEEQLQRFMETDHFISLSTVSVTASSDNGYAQDARSRDALECFHLTVARASQTQAAGKSLFRTELRHLIALLSNTKSSKHKQSNRDRKQLGFVSSCVGIILQQPKVLQYSESDSTRLIGTMIEHLPLSSDAGKGTKIASLIKALLLSEEISTNAELFNDCCSGLLSSIDEHGGLSPSARDIFFILPLPALKKSLAQKLADVLVQRLRSNATTASALEQILPDLGLLEMLITSFSVSLGRPKKWAELIDLAEHVLIRTGASGSKLHQTAVGCISKMFNVLWSRCQSDEMPSEMSAALAAFQSRLQELLSSSSTVSAQAASEAQPLSAGNVHDPALPLDVSEVTTKDLEEIAVRINMQVSALGSEKSSELARLVGQKKLDTRSLLLLSAIICRVSAVDAAQDPSLHQSMSRLATLNFALEASTAADLSFALETCRIVLEKHVSVVNQYTIETLLSSITALTSANATQTTSNQPSAIFNRLCSLLGHLLSRHRKRFGGRYHLLLSTLQGLLKCLFFAGTSSPATSQAKSQVLFIRSLPSWLRNSKSPLEPKSAEHFTRLLTTICDPSVSSIRRKKPNELTDETKKVKSLAGQYMQYLVMEYCRCNLHGRIPSASREKLMPGLYAVLDVMDRETMRGMNGAMDANGRAVWKGLYQDWERWGRWDRK